ncbi:MAG TPA: arylsulfotransferase family protein [Streptosporangiaceae bacterium]
MTEDLSRRRLFGLAGVTAAGAAGLSLAGCSKASGLGGGPTLASPMADSSAGGPPWVTRPDLTPPKISVRRSGLGGDSQYIFLNAPYSGTGHGGTIILSPGGEFVYFGPNTATKHHMDVSVQTYKGQQMLAWWEGVLVEGFGIGEIVLADSTYTVKHRIKAVQGYPADFHEVNITPQGTALIDIYSRHSNVDLSHYGGGPGMHLVSGMVQEIDVATGALVFKWDSWNPKNPHVPLSETHQQFGVGDGGNGTAATPYNYFHINSVAEVEPGNPASDLLVSGRNTWTVYRISRKTGNVVDRIGGKRSTYSMGPRTRFYWQHHVRLHPGNIMTVFDNGSSPPVEKQSRALKLHLDDARKHVTLEKQYIHPNQTYLAGAMGSAQLLPDGRMFVGWGTEPHFSEFSADGRLLLDGDIEIGSPSYRGFSENWVGKPPLRQLAVAARHRSGGATVYASWNGATEVKSWAVLAGRSSSNLSQVGTARKAGFETAMSVSSRGPWFAVEARDGKGRVLGRSKTVKIG